MEESNMQPNTFNQQNPPVVPDPTPAPVVMQPQVFGPQPAIMQEPAQPAVPAVAPDQSAAPITPATPTRKSRGVLKAVAAIVAIMVAFTSGYFVHSGIVSASQSNATKQARAFIAALNAGDNAKAYNLTSTNLRAKQSKSEFTTTLGDLRAAKPSYSDESTQFSGNTAVFTATEDGLPPADNNKTTGDFTVTLVKAGMLDWKIDSVSVQ